MRALITGVNGFVGGHLSSLLLHKGLEVYGIDRKNNSKINTLGIKIFNVDITNKSKISNLIKLIKPNYIFHLAAISSVQLSSKDPTYAKKITIYGTKNLLSACINNKLNPKILIPSSAYVYGNPKIVPISESCLVNPMNEYGKIKLQQEKIALNFFKKYKLNIIISRSFNHIGPNQSIGFVCSDFAKQIVEIEKDNMNKLNEIMVGDLSAKRDFTDVRDVVKAYLLLLEKGEAGEIYNLGSGVSYSMQEVLNKLISKSNSNQTIKIIKNKSLFRKSDIPLFVSDSTKLIKTTGWKPRIKLDDSLEDILNYWRNLV